jgi:Circularly permutated YpsA SLOG family
VLHDCRGLRFLLLENDERTKERAFSGVFLCGMMFDLAEDAGSDEQLKMVQKILSGGQTGADRAGLDFAIHAGLEHGGYVPS